MRELANVSLALEAEALVLEPGIDRHLIVVEEFHSYRIGQRAGFEWKHSVRETDLCGVRRCVQLRIAMLAAMSRREAKPCRNHPVAFEIAKTAARTKLPGGWHGPDAEANSHVPRIVRRGHAQLAQIVGDGRGIEPTVHRLAG